MKIVRGWLFGERLWLVRGDLHLRSIALSFLLRRSSWRRIAFQRLFLIRCRGAADSCLSARIVTFLVSGVANISCDCAIKSWTESTWTWDDDSGAAVRFEGREKTSDLMGYWLAESGWDVGDALLAISLSIIFVGVDIADNLERW